MTEYETPQRMMIRIGRLRKKIEKLIKQRDSYKEQLVHYRNILDLHPSFDYRYEKYQDRKDKDDLIKTLKQQVKEQSSLIEILQSKSIDK